MVVLLHVEPSLVIFQSGADPIHCRNELGGVKRSALEVNDVVNAEGLDLGDGHGACGLADSAEVDESAIVSAGSQAYGGDGADEAGGVRGEET